jgi:hypothetical protein
MGFLVGIFGGGFMGLPELCGFLDIPNYMIT